MIVDTKPLGAVLLGSHHDPETPSRGRLYDNPDFEHLPYFLSYQSVVPWRHSTNLRIYRPSFCELDYVQHEHNGWQKATDIPSDDARIFKCTGDLFTPFSCQMLHLCRQEGGTVAFRVPFKRQSITIEPFQVWFVWIFIQDGLNQLSHVFQPTGNTFGERGHVRCLRRTIGFRRERKVLTISVIAIGYCRLHFKR